MRISDWSSDVCSSDLFPFAEGLLPYDAAALVAAIEAEDEARALRLARGALFEGRAFREIEEPLAEAALAHYQDFGHALIYVLKTGELIDRLGPASAEPLLLNLVRSLVYASREDRSEEHTSELQSLMRISYAVFCL